MLTYTHVICDPTHEALSRTSCVLEEHYSLLVPTVYRNQGESKFPPLPFSLKEQTDLINVVECADVNYDFNQSCACNTSIYS